MNSQLFENQSSPKAKRVSITIFGAESTGKTTLSKQLASKLQATWIYEFARPYLEITGAPISPQSMKAIWDGQQVIQTMAEGDLVIHDTDLFSTVGYWQFPHWHSALGDCPKELVSAASSLKSDLYIITPCTIPFESDPIRYGGNQREGNDDYWIAVCEQYNLPYVVLNSSTRNSRLKESVQIITRHIHERGS